MPDLSNVQQNDIAKMLQSIDGHNPYVFIPLVILWIFTFATSIVSYKAIKQTSRKWIIYVGIASFTCVTIAVTCMCLTKKIYGDVLPSIINKPITIQVVQNNTPMEVTGRPTDMGIRMVYGDGLNYMILILVFSIVSLLISLRWISEGTLPTKLREQIRINI